MLGTITVFDCELRKIVLEEVGIRTIRILPNSEAKSEDINQAPLEVDILFSFFLMRDQDFKLTTLSLTPAQEPGKLNIPSFHKTLYPTRLLPLAFYTLILTETLCSPCVDHV